MKFMVRMNWHCIYLKNEYQDQCPRNTSQIALDLKRRLFLHHNIDLLGFQLTWFGITWLLGYIRDKTHKIWEDPMWFRRIWKIWSRFALDLGRGLKLPKFMNNSSFTWKLRKIILYYVYTRLNWHSSEIWSKTEHFIFWLFGPRALRSNCRI